MINEKNIPKDMKKGCRYGLLTLTGSYKVDKFQARHYEAECECGNIIYRDAKNIRKSKCCLVKNHPELRKENTSKADRTKELNNKHVGSTIKGHTVIEIRDDSRYRVVDMSCNKCGNIVTRRLSKFLEGRVNGCLRNHKEDIERIRTESEAKRIQKAKEAEIRKQDRIKANKGIFRYKDLTGQVFGRLTVLRYVGARITNSGRVALFECKCECGETCVVGSSVLKAGRKLCDKELLELKREQGAKASRNRVRNNRNKGIFPKGSFRRIHNKKMTKYSWTVYHKYQGVCQRCKTIHPKKESHCHHMIPLAVNKNTAFIVSNGILLCRECHREFHKTYGWVGFKPKDIFTFIKDFPRNLRGM